jgi:ATP-binding cassette subfamily B protein
LFWQAAKQIYSTIDTEPKIDSLAETGERPVHVEGRVTFRDVTFNYPARPHDRVLDHFSLEVAPKSTVAVVGTSGAGKSTLVGLLERFYDPTSGSIALDGVDIRTCNVQWLRRPVARLSAILALIIEFMSHCKRC